MVNYHHVRVELYKKLRKSEKVYSSSPIILDEVFGFSISRKINKGVSTLTFKVSNAKNKLFRRLFSGDGSTKVFTLPFSFPADYINEISSYPELFQVYVNGSLKSYPADYTVSGNQLIFSSAPASGHLNIDVRYNIVSSDDLVRIYIWKNSDTYSYADRVVEGIITEPKTDSAANKKYITVYAKGLMNVILSALAPPPLIEKHKCYEHMINILAHINSTNPTRRILGATPEEWESELGNPTKKYDGSEFPDVDYTTAFKNCIECLDDLSSDTYTEDGQYMFWVDYIPERDAYGFFWRPKKEVLPQTTLTKSISATDQTIYVDSTKNWLHNAGFIKIGSEIIKYNGKTSNAFLNCVRGAEGTTATSHSAGETVSGFYEIVYGQQEMLAMSAEQDTDEVINFVIYNVGTAPDGSNVDYLEINTDSVASQFGKWLYYTKTSNTISQIIAKEQNAHPDSFPRDDQGRFTSVYPSSYPYTFTFNALDDNLQELSYKAVAYSDDDYNKIIKTKAHAEARKEVLKLLSLYSGARMRAKITYSFTNKYAIGALALVTLPDLGLYSKKLRIVQIDYDFWTTTLTLEEDYGTI